MIMQRNDSDDRDGTVDSPDIFLDHQTMISPTRSVTNVGTAPDVGYMYRGVPQDRNARRFRFDRVRIDGAFTQNRVPAPKWLSAPTANESIATELFFG